MSKEVVEVPVLSERIRKLGVPLTPVLRANGFLYLSGMPPLDPETGQLHSGASIEEQTRMSLRAIKHALEAAGSSLDRVVKTTIYATNSAHYARINGEYAKHFSEPFPTRSFVTVASWPMDFDIEIECVALA